MWQTCKCLQLLPNRRQSLVCCMHAGGCWAHATCMGHVGTCWRLHSVCMLHGMVHAAYCTVHVTSCWCLHSACMLHVYVCVASDVSFRWPTTIQFCFSLQYMYHHLCLPWSKASLRCLEFALNDNTGWPGQRTFMLCGVHNRIPVACCFRLPRVQVAGLRMRAPEWASSEDNPLCMPHLCQCYTFRLWGSVCVQPDEYVLCSVQIFVRDALFHLSLCRASLHGQQSTGVRLGKAVGVEDESC